RVPAHPEGAWDALAALHDRPPRAGAVVLLDDLDALAQRMPPEYAQSVLERVEGLVRRAGDDGVLVVAGAHRLTGAVSRIADLFPRRLLLPFATRLDHASAGGEASAFQASAPPGRGRLDGSTVQIALAPPVGRTAAAEDPSWTPMSSLTGVVARRSPRFRRALAAWEEHGVRVLAVDEYLADPASVAAGRVAVVGEPDDWQRQWRLLADVRGDHDLVVDTSCASELRVLAGYRGVPPYCDPGRARAWLMSAGADPVRIVLPDADVRPNRRDDALTSPDRST
ncbi:hypothetical protein ACFFIR_14850, partial [Microbacterium arthrosphaerae]